MKAKQMHKYLMDNYGKVAHDMDNMEYACGELAELHELTPKEVFLFMVEDKPIKGMYTHSYGFNTREGRALKQQFEAYYYEN